MTGLALPLTIVVSMVISLVAALLAARRRRARSALAPLPAGIRALASNVRAISGLGADLALPPARGSLRPTVTLTALR
ncbi:conserved hypothetical protein [Anaeromyxobacter dehalogenans 2CP-1]|uniref:Uncharacterized protein n=1 Tax=Anaeromyxobacter dehalogenans (strain ATCC BAA-258 / DSM 21875 / 2CP-1) TaxID=455488 RepID=B8JGW6_ANAD2|nr:hypothetical protein [Anaeromyxobacter dehalogenans]ACL66603.1 conserved hypothetical protein [Anaeromyxobacter dehalogenans 2CP-1]